MPRVVESKSTDNTSANGLTTDSKSRSNSNLKLKNKHAKSSVAEVSESADADEDTVSGGDENNDDHEHDNNDEDEVDDDDEDDEDDDAEPSYEVEAIQSHEWKKKRGRNQPPVLLYNVKWKGYPESDNTMEPEENLLGSRDLLASYHRAIGGAPQPPSKPAPKQKSSKPPKSEGSTISVMDDSTPPPAKRLKKTPRAEPIHSDNSDSEDDFGSWQPSSASWENDIKEIITIERDEKSHNLTIFLIFKNGKKSKVKNNVVRKKCPQRLLDFYEAHLSV